MVGQREAMSKHYVADVHRFRSSVPRCPKHTPLPQQEAFKSGGRATLRVLSWNINILCGADSSASVGQGMQRIDPGLVASIIDEVNADVVCLQETLAWIPPKYKDYLERSGVGDVAERMALLDAKLVEQGLCVPLRSCGPPSSGNPVLLATRLPVSHAETMELAPVEAAVHGMSSPRKAVYAEIQVAAAGGAVMGIYATHLHHVNHTSGEGQRAAEIRSLLGHAKERRSNDSRLATVITGDFNQPRQIDYSEREWDVVSAGLAGVSQPEDDGVHSILQESGWVCAFDVPPEHNNFGGRSCPPFTHWTGTTVDYLYLSSEGPRQSGSEETTIGISKSASPASTNVVGSYVVFSGLSDHLPVVTDITLSIPRP